LCRQPAQFSRPLRRCLPRRRLPLRRAIDVASLKASAASLTATPSPSPTPSLGDPAFSLDAACGVPVVVSDLVAIPDSVAPSLTSSPTPSLCTAYMRCVILLPSRPADSFSPADSLEVRHARWYSSSRPERVEVTPDMLSSVRITSSVRLIANLILVSPSCSLISSVSSPPARANHRRDALTTPMSKPWLGLYDISRKQLSITNSHAQFLLYISFA
jgi:hypothetical protein